MVTHVGSLPRPQEIVDAFAEQRASGPEFEANVERAVADVVRQQVENGIDIPSDGEMSKPGFSNYVDERLTGFELRPNEPSQMLIGSRDRKAFPDFYEILDRGGGTVAAFPGTTVCTGPIMYQGEVSLKRDLENFIAALSSVSVTEAFVPAIAPGTVAAQRRNDFYGTEDEFLFAIAEALAPEYKAIVDAGFVLQIDDPRMVTAWDAMDPEPAVDDYQKYAQVRVDAINHAIAGLPTDRIRYHVCWGSWPGPHSTDIPLKHLLPAILRLNVGGFAVEAANPQHAHEWQLFEATRLPDGMVLIPGLIAHSTNLVEHPEYIAQRLVQYAGLVGRENVIAGADCGFAQGVGIARVHPSIMWAKFRSLAEGARLATQQLWSR